MFGFSDAIKIAIWVCKNLDIVIVVASILLLILDSGMSTGFCVAYIALGVAIRAIRIVLKKRRQ